MGSNHIIIIILIILLILILHNNIKTIRQENLVQIPASNQNSDIYDANNIAESHNLPWDKLMNNCDSKINLDNFTEFDLYNKLPNNINNLLY